MMVPSDFARNLADRLISQIEAGTAPWQRDWEAGEPFAPYNPITGNRYRGINFVSLLSAGREDPRWMTYKQALAEEWQVKAEEKSTRIQHWVWEEERIRIGKDGQPVLDAENRPIKDRIRLVRPKVILASVFNAEQIEGIPELERGQQYQWNPITEAERLLKVSGARIEHASGDRAYYRLSTDTIHLPAKEQFSEASKYYATALHEVAHWTGHPDRMNRDLGHPMGSEGYAREELRAEIASMIMGSDIGIGYEVGQHAAYVESWVQILRDRPNEILYAAAAAEKISEYVQTLEQKQELRQRPEVSVAKQRDIPEAERIYLAVPYEERGQAKREGAHWDAAKKAWYVGPEVDQAKIAKWEIRYQETPTLDPRAEFAEVLRSIGAVLEGDHPIMNGEHQRIPALNDKRGERTIFYVGHLDGVPNGYAENNRTKETRRWKARGQHLTAEQKTELLAQAEQKRFEWLRLERARYEATAERLINELRSIPSGVVKTGYHEKKRIEPLEGTRVRNGDLIVPGYDIEGKLWTVQYVKEDGTKRFAKDSRKHGCFHVVDAPNAAAALQKLSSSAVVVVTEGYATAASIARQCKAPAVVAFDSGNLLEVATTLREQYKLKGIIIAGDDDHRQENNPGRTKAQEAAKAVNATVVFPMLNKDQKQRGLTDFNDLEQENPSLVQVQLDDAIKQVRTASQEWAQEAIEELTLTKNVD